MKKLVTSKTIEDFANSHGGNFFVVDDETLISPAARDTAKSRDIRIIKMDSTSRNSCSMDSTEAPVNGVCTESTKACEAIDAPRSSAEMCDKEQIIAAVIKVLADKGLLDEILK